MSPYTLPHIIYVFLVVVFVAIQSYMFIYNIRMRNRERELLGKGASGSSKEQLLVKAQESFRRQGS